MYSTYNTHGKNSKRNKNCYSLFCFLYQSKAEIVFPYSSSVIVYVLPVGVVGETIQSILLMGMDQTFSICRQLKFFRGPQRGCMNLILASPPSTICTIPIHQTLSWTHVTLLHWCYITFMKNGWQVEIVGVDI